ncbi:MAG TPA: hypothetical protein VIA98_04250 [Allosphingosinicella sp.]|jgi:hypothetical protein
MEYRSLATLRPDSKGAVAAVWPTAAVEAKIAPLAAAVAKSAPFVPTPAMADVATGVGRLVAGSYGALILVFFALFARSPLAAFSITICGFFVAMYFAVPRIFLTIEAAPGRRPSFDRFMRTGLDTLTGRTGGRDALIQMLIVPVLVTLGLAAMGIIGKIYIG